VTVDAVATPIGYDGSVHGVTTTAYCRYCRWTTGGGIYEVQMSPGESYSGLVVQYDDSGHLVYQSATVYCFY